MHGLSSAQIPDWVPTDVIRYLEHTEAQRSIRQIARDAGCHASTVLRQIRKLEQQRDDLLIESVLERLATVYYNRNVGTDKARGEATEINYSQRDIAHCLSKLSLAGAVLVVGRDLDRAVIVRDVADQTERVTVDRLVPEILALQYWISSTGGDRVHSYRITQAGRVALTQLMAAAEQQARVSNETLTQSGVAGAMAQSAELLELPNCRRRLRYGLQETPLQVLARMQDRDGKPFLSVEMIRSGERLREDYELAQIGQHLVTAQAAVAQSCNSDARRGYDPSKEAFQRVNHALCTLGPGLSDIALRCCCYLEGLEAAEKHLGWSARSGKIVLRIALEQLHSHYSTQPRQNQMIG